MISDTIRKDFPILEQKINGNPLIYFDNAATTQKSTYVINTLHHYYTTLNANIHRGAHYLANIATEAYENSRLSMAEYIHAIPEEIVFTSGTTSSINLLATSWARKNLTQQDCIVLTEMEHHANIVPWLALQQELKFEIRYISMKRDCTLDLSNLDSLLTSNVKLVSMAYVSNAIGTIHPIKEIIQKTQKLPNCLFHLDAAQAIQHIPLDVRELGIDFMSFSSHKMYGPMGVGVFWGKKEHLESMSPFMYGGEMIKEVYLDSVTYSDLPFKFEGGTPNVADVIGLGAAIESIKIWTLQDMGKIETSLHQYLWNELNQIEQVELYTPQNKSLACVSFNVKGVHPFDVGQLLDAKGIAIRTGHLCCQPLMRKLDIEGVCRASLAFYNTQAEIDRFITHLNQAIAILC